MIKATINKKKYNICDQWEDVTLDTFIQLADIEIPKKLESSWVASTKMDVKGEVKNEVKDETKNEAEKKIAEAQYQKIQKSITDDDIIKVFLEYYSKVIKILSNIPQDVIDNITVHEITKFFEAYLRPFSLSMIYSMPVVINDGVTEIYEPKEIKSLKIGRQVFYFPESMNLFNDNIPMADEKIASFAEAADIDLAIKGLQGEGIKRLPIFMGIYCRKRGEEYNEKMAVERAELFTKARMSEVWSLFFTIALRMQRLQSYIQIYSLQKKEEGNIRKAA